MKTILSMLVFLLFASSFFVNAQEQVAKRASSNHSFVLSDQIIEFPSSDIREGNDFDLKYTDDPLHYRWGNTATEGTMYANACISFTQAQMLSFANGTNYLHTITLIHPSPGGMPGINNDGCKIWIKETLDGPVVYEQSFIPTPGASQSVTLTTPYTLPVGKSLVLGFTILLENVVSGTDFYPIGMSETGNVPGSFHYLYTPQPNSHGEYAGFLTPPPANAPGCLLIKAIGQGVSHNLAATDLTTNLHELQLAGTDYVYTVNVRNTGSAAQNNYKVQIIDENNAIIASKDVTTSIAPYSSIDIDLTIQQNIPGELNYRGKVILEGDAIAADDITAAKSFMIYPMQPIAYCDRAVTSIYYWPDATVKDYAIRVPKAEIAPYVGKFITAIEVGVDGKFGNLINYVLPWIAMGNFNDPSGFPGEEGDVFDWFDESFTTMKEGWNVIPVDPPIEITDNNLYIGYKANALQGFGGGITLNKCNPANLEHGHWVKNVIWFNMNHSEYAGNLAIIATIVDSLPTAVMDFNVEKTEFRIVPNPAKDNIKISAAKNFNKIEVVNFLGQTVISLFKTGTQTTVDVSNLVAGVYFVRMTTENGVNVKKFIKQ